MKKWLLRIGYVFLAVFLLLWSAVAVGGVYFTVRPRPSDIEDIATLADHPVVPVSIVAEDGVTLSAWYVPAGGDRAVVLLSGIDSNRNASRGHGALYLEHGYSALLPDLRATGKSEGRFVTIGWHERKDLIACFNYLQSLGYEHIGAHGHSLGAATICFAMPELPELAFAVLESSYDTLGNAVRNRLALFHVPHFIAYPYYALLGLTTCSPPWRMRPMDYVGHNAAPTLIMAGDSEPEVKVSDTEAIFARSAAELKRLHFFAGGRHQNFLRHYTDEYKEVLLDFLHEAIPGE